MLGMDFALSKSSHLLILCSLLLLHGSFGAEPLLNLCSGSANYTNGSQFQTNLNQLLSSLVADGPRDGFYNTSDGINTDQVYGLSQCRRNISNDSCASCLDTASAEIVRRCPNRKEAVIRYDDCLLRYSNRSFFSIIDNGMKTYYWVTSNVTDPDLYHQVLGKMMDDLSNQVASDPSKLLFATKAARLTAFQNIYGMVWCSRDLSMKDCNTCLRSLISDIPTCCNISRGGQIVAVSCNIRFEFYPFFGIPAEVATPPPSTTTSPPPSQPTKGEWNDHHH